MFVCARYWVHVVKENLGGVGVGACVGKAIASRRGGDEGTWGDGEMGILLMACKVFFVWNGCVQGGWIGPGAWEENGGGALAAWEMRCVGSGYTWDREVGEGEEDGQTMLR